MPEVRNLWAESQFVTTNCCNQVDFCPFRGPEAPFGAPAILARGRKSSDLRITLPRTIAARVVLNTLAGWGEVGYGTINRVSRP